MALSRVRRDVLAVLLTGVFATAGAAGCGKEEKPAPPTPASQAAGREVKPCEELPPSNVADGVNDDQGGSTPGTDPCHSP